MHGLRWTEPNLRCIARELVYAPSMQNLIFECSAARVHPVQNIIHVRVFKAAEDAAELDMLEKTIQRGVQSQNGACGLMLTMDRFETSPTAEKRQMVVDMMQRLSTSLTAVALTLPNDGIKATITRSVLNTILLASRLRTTKIFSEMDSASLWMAEKMAQKGVTLNHFQIHEDAKALIRAPRQPLNARGTTAPTRQPTV